MDKIEAMPEFNLTSSAPGRGWYAFVYRTASAMFFHLHAGAFTGKKQNERETRRRLEAAAQRGALTHSAQPSAGPVFLREELHPRGRHGIPVATDQPQAYKPQAWYRGDEHATIGSVRREIEQVGTQKLLATLETLRRDHPSSCNVTHDNPLGC